MNKLDSFGESAERPKDNRPKGQPKLMDAKERTQDRLKAKIIEGLDRLQELDESKKPYEVREEGDHRPLWVKDPTIDKLYRDIGKTEDKVMREVKGALKKCSDQTLVEVIDHIEREYEGFGRSFYIGDVYREALTQVDASSDYFFNKIDYRNFDREAEAILRAKSIDNPESFEAVLSGLKSYASKMSEGTMYSGGGHSQQVAVETLIFFSENPEFFPTDPSVLSSFSQFIPEVVKLVEIDGTEPSDPLFRYQASLRKFVRQYRSRMK